MWDRLLEHGTVSVLLFGVLWVIWKLGRVLTPMLFNFFEDIIKSMTQIKEKLDKLTNSVDNLCSELRLANGDKGGEKGKTRPKI